MTAKKETIRENNKKDRIEYNPVFFIRLRRNVFYIILTLVGFEYSFA